MKKKKNFYVVWVGKIPGIYKNWNECKQQIEGFSGAKYKGFFTIEEAKTAFSQNYDNFIGQNDNKENNLSPENIKKYGNPIKEAIAVDASYSGKTKQMEYRGIFIETKTELFAFGPITGGSNNIGEFLALVHVLAYQVKYKLKYPIYSDSKIAISWVKQKICKTKVDRNKENPKILQLINRAENWLKKNESSKFKILKWHTNAWGEIPADYGRK